MKTKHNLLNKVSLGLGLAGALAFASGCATNSSTGDQMKAMKGGEHQLMLNKVETKEQAEAVKPDDTFAMVCGKCKTVYVTRVKQGTKGAQLLMGPAPTELIGTHECAGCGGTWTITGVGKGATTELKHTCTKCGDDSGFCCATKPGSGATKGMEKGKH
jgi:hypothetical protein